jgi:hypothetical protein
MSWIILAGLSALLESFKDVASERSLPLIDVYLISWTLFARMLPVLAGCWILDKIPPRIAVLIMIGVFVITVL